MPSSVSDDLRNAIRELMENPLFEDFNLGGGTNLALKYNHRLSVDIDLFSTGVVHIDKLEKIADFFIEKYDIKEFIDKNNFDINNPYSEKAWLQIEIPQLETKIDIIQNIPLLNELQIIDGIRLIHDDDIGALKLIAAANRGNQKDFYDLYLLTNEKPIEFYYDTLMKRKELFPDNKTIFDEPINKPIIYLEKDVSPLCDFNNGNNLSKPGNKILFTTNSPVNVNWFSLKQEWKKRVVDLSQKRNLIFNETPVISVNKDNKRKFGFGM